jgi:hypothetical protein
MWRVAIMGLIDAGDTNGAEQALDLFLGEFKNHPYAGEALRRIATEYYLVAEELGKQGRDEQRDQYLERARGVWGRVIESTSESFPSRLCLKTT